MAEDEVPAKAEAEEVPATPDLFEPFVACRSWTVNKRNAVPGDETVYQFEGSVDTPWRLWSTAHTDFAWKIGMNHAICRGHNSARLTGHPVPSRGCSCGLYALNDWGRLFAEHPALRPGKKENSFNIYGTVELWGLVIPATQGYRAERAQVRSLLLPQFPTDFGKAGERRAARALLRSMQYVVRRTADAYGVPVVETLEELSDATVEEVPNEHRQGGGTSSGGTLGVTTSNPGWLTGTSTPTWSSTTTTGHVARNLAPGASVRMVQMQPLPEQLIPGQTTYRDTQGRNYLWSGTSWDPVD